MTLVRLVLLPVLAGALAPSPGKMSASVPFLTAQPALEGWVGAETGFDPLGLSALGDMRWLREAEIKHGRLSMLATLGFVVPELGWKFPGIDDQVWQPNPLRAWAAAPPEYTARFVLAVFLVEFLMYDGKGVHFDDGREPGAFSLS